MSTTEFFQKKRPAHLLEAIEKLWLSVGDSLSDSDFTQLLQEEDLPAEAGFRFLSFSNGCVTLAVPEQDPSDWYSENNEIEMGKEDVAGAIAKKYGLLLSEPANGPLNFYPPSGSAVRHHLALADHRQTVIVAHQLFLKIRLFGKGPDQTYGRNPQFPLPLGPDLLDDISHLYRRKTRPAVPLSAASVKPA